MAARKSFTATAAATFGTNVGVAVISLLNVLITARILGPGGRGELALLTTITILTASLAAFGLYEANANIGAREPGKRGALAANSLVLALGLGGAAAVLVAALVVVFPALGGGTDPLLQALALAAIPVLILQSGLGTLIQSQYGFAVTNTAWLLAPSTSLALNAALAAFGLLTVGTAVIVWIAGQVAATALLAWHAVRRLEGVPRPDVPLARQMLSFGSRTHLGRVMTMGNYRLDQWFVGAIAGQRELGLYSVAVAWAEALFYLPTALNGSATRPGARIGQRGGRAGRDRLSRRAPAHGAARRRARDRRPDSLRRDLRRGLPRLDRRLARARVRRLRDRRPQAAGERADRSEQADARERRRRDRVRRHGRPGSPADPVARRNRRRDRLDLRVHGGRRSDPGGLLPRARPSTGGAPSARERARPAAPSAASRRHRPAGYAIATMRHPHQTPACSRSQR